MPSFSVTIRELPAIRVAGMSVITTMDMAKQDCTRLWDEKFGPCMAAFPADPDWPHHSFGLSVMDQPDDKTFTYWAVMPIQAGAAVPPGMAETVIPAGQYASAAVENLGCIGDAFTYVYSTWPETQNTYTLDWTKPSVELYTSDFLQNGSLTILCPLAER